MKIAVDRDGPDGGGGACGAAMACTPCAQADAVGGASVIVVKATTACFSDMVRVAGYLVPRRMAVVNVDSDGYKIDRGRGRPRATR